MPAILKLKDSFQKLFNKLLQLREGPHAVAAGFACGAAISMTPFVGFHLILAALTAYLLRGSIVAGALGTVVGNPWTFALIWPATLYAGRWFLGQPITAGIDFEALFSKMAQAVKHLDFDLLISDVWPVLWPMIVGCIPFYIVVWFISYALVKRMLEKYKANKQAKDAS